MVKIKRYLSSDININENEVARYSGSEKNYSFNTLLKECLKELPKDLTFSVCYEEFDISVNGNVINFPFANIKSENLSQMLLGSNKAIIFACTCGLFFDRQLFKYGKISPVKSIIYQGLGAERAESLCDAFVKDIKKDYNLNFTPRFSPGYGDLSLSFQKDIFNALNPSKIGLTLNDSLIMSPSKSVTAIIGLTEKQVDCKLGCNGCKTNCPYKR